MQRRDFLAGAAVVWSVPAISTVKLTQIVGSGPPRTVTDPTTAAPGDPTFEDPAAVDSPSAHGPSEQESSGPGGQLPFTGDNTKRDAAVGALTVAAGAALVVGSKDRTAQE